MPLIPKEKSLQLLDEYEGLLESGRLPALPQISQGHGSRARVGEARRWIASKVASGPLTRQDQLEWLSAMFPEAPGSILQGAAGLRVLEGPWEAVEVFGIGVSGGP